MKSIRNVCTLQQVGILADKKRNEDWPEFLRFNLIYGFNGSGKSTLSRIFASLRDGRLDEKLPEGCKFELLMEDGTICKAPDALTGLESRVCVFNIDFISRNLRWDEGKANSIFYISEKQAELANKLRAAESKLADLGEQHTAEKRVFAEREKVLRTYRTERAKLVSSRLHLGNRRYEASHLRSDYETFEYDDSYLLPGDVLDGLENVARLLVPLPALSEIYVDFKTIWAQIESARYCAEVSIGSAMLAEIENHPSMTEWIKTGHDFHQKHELSDCLFCGGKLTNHRKDELAAALEGRLGHLLTVLKETKNDLSDGDIALVKGKGSWPKPADVDPKFRNEYETQLTQLKHAVGELQAVLKEAQRITRVRLKEPTATLNHGLPHEDRLQASFKAARDAVSAVNETIRKHNAAIAEFEERQEEARLAIRKHYFAEGYGEYIAAQDALSKAGESLADIASTMGSLKEEIFVLKSKVRTHGPAAEHITKLVHSYLGHTELAVIAVDEGYELHRHNQLVRGSPSEGEKTAIALCYFLSTLRAEGRDLKHLIVVIDDPISSLDTKAMNYACALVLSHLKNAGQVFVLTHNQHCMTEFRKAWRGLGEPRNPATSPTARFLFVDVKLREGANQREACLVEMPSLLRAYDSEYHFLCQKVLEFEAAAEGHSEYGFMMPNVIRRVLEVFLAFKVPGSSPLKDKLVHLSRQHPALDPTRLSALERLTQVESHSDNLDDLVSYSSTTVEEARDANAALLDLMMIADSDHTTAIRRQCRPEAKIVAHRWISARAGPFEALDPPQRPHPLISAPFFSPAALIILGGVRGCAGPEAAGNSREARGPGAGSPRICRRVSAGLPCRPASSFETRRFAALPRMRRAVGG